MKHIMLGAFLALQITQVFCMADTTKLTLEQQNGKALISAVSSIVSRIDDLRKRIKNAGGDFTQGKQKILTAEMPKIERLLANKIDLNARYHVPEGLTDKRMLDLNGSSALHFAVVLNNPALINLLLNAQPGLIIGRNRIPANINAQNLHGETPLHLAVQRGYLDSILALTQNKNHAINYALTNNVGQTVLHTLVESINKYNNDDLTKAFGVVAHPDIINAQDANKITALYIAILNPGADDLIFTAISLLVFKKANPNLPDLFGRTPFHVLALTGLNEKLDEYTRLFIQNGANAKAPDALSLTPFHLAAIKENQTSPGKTEPIVLKSMIKYLRSANKLADVINFQTTSAINNTELKVRRTFKEIVTESDGKQIAKEVIKEETVPFSKGKLNLTDAIVGGETALHLAAFSSNAASVSALLEAGADKEIKNDADKTARDLVIEQIDIREANIENPESESMLGRYKAELEDYKKIMDLLDGIIVPLPQGDLLQEFILFTTQANGLAAQPTA